MRMQRRREEEQDPLSLSSRAAKILMVSIAEKSKKPY
jgi:hypothetical protein